jgi:prepilin-type N-terminal cleavage/methylation domain-containing protein
MCRIGGVVSVNPKQRGLTLIELMVTLVLLALLATMSVSLGSDWINSSRTQQARSEFEKGWGLARALSLRNPCRSLQKDAAATLILSHKTSKGYELTVEVAGAPSCTYLASRPSPEWSASLPSGIQISIGGAVLTDNKHSWSINSRGLPLSAISNSEIVIKRGGAQNDEIMQWL